MTPRLTLRDFALAFALLAICAFFAIRSPQFLLPRNLSLLLTDVAITATLALGMLLVILPGHIDLSAGSGVGLIGGIAAVLVTGGETPTRLIGMARDLLQRLFGSQAANWLPMPPWSAAASMLAALVVGLILWALMGGLIVRARIPAFIVTLGGLLVYKGFFWQVIQSHTVPITAPTAAAPGITSIWLHLGQWRWPIWEIARDAGGNVELFLRAQDGRAPVLAGSGNIFALLTTSYITPAAGYVLGAIVFVAAALIKMRSVSSRRAAGIVTEANEVVFLRLFITGQLLFLLLLVANQYRGLPLPAVILAAVALTVSVLTNHTAFGRYLYAIGGNEEAAIVSGVPVQRVTIMAFVLMGAIVAITGFLQTAYQGHSTTTVGDLMELDAVAACVIGGVSLKGGRGGVLGVMFGALIMAALLNGMSLLSVEIEKKFIARGLVLILAVWMDVRLSKRV